MKCSNCGQENADGNKFCYACGAPLATDGEQGQQEPFTANEYGQQPYSPEANNRNSGTGNILIKIFGVIFAVLYAISFFRGLYGVLLGVRGFFWAGALYGIFNIISAVLAAVSCALMCMMLLAMAFCKNKADVESSMYGVVIAGILRAAVGIVALLLSGILYVSRPWLGVDVLGCFLTVLYAFVTVAVMVLISVLTGEVQIAGRSMDEIKGMVLRLPEIISDMFQSAQAKEPDAGLNGANVNYGGGYTAPQTPPQASQMQTPPQASQMQTPPQYAYNAQGGAVIKPAFRLKTDRSLAMYILLTICTCGIYSYYFLYAMARDANTICEGDGDKTGGLVAFILLSLVTCGIYSVYWEYKLGNRLAENAPRYGLSFQENGTSVLLWHLFGALLCFLGPFIAMNILIKNMNRLSIAYNQYNGI